MTNFKYKFALGAVALVPLLVAVGCEGVAQNPPPQTDPPAVENPTAPVAVEPETPYNDLQIPPLYTAITADVCQEYGSPLWDGDAMGELVCFTVPDSGEFMLAEVNNPLLQLFRRIPVCRDIICDFISNSYLRLLAEEPTLTPTEATQKVQDRIDETLPQYTNELEGFLND